MKRLFAFCLAAAMILSGCASTQSEEAVTQQATTGSSAADTTALETTLPPARLEGSVTVTGDGKEDTQLTATAALDEPNAVALYQWYLDGAALQDANSPTLQIPVNAAGKTVTVGVRAEGYDNEIMSDPVPVTENPSDYKTMAGMYHSSKVIGRVFLSRKDPTAVQIEWPACGFEFNVDAQGGTLKIHYETNYESTIAVFIDGVEQPRPTLVPIMGGLFCEFPLEAGAHTIKILRDSEPETTQIGHVTLKGVEFAGSVTEKPADKDLYVEIIGDSISSGIGTLGVFTEGGSAKMSDHSATHTYGYYVAQDLDADYSIVAKGGIGVVQGEGSQGINMMNAYEYLWRFSLEDLYCFSRKPDLIILELGANDSFAHNVTTELYKQEIQKFIQMLRQIHGADVPILWLGRLQDNYHGLQYKAVLELIDEMGDPNLYAASFPCGSDGTGGVAGHPSAQNHRDFADQVTKFIKETIGIGA